MKSLRENTGRCTYRLGKPMENRGRPHHVTGNNRDKNRTRWLSGRLKLPAGGIHLFVAFQDRGPWRAHRRGAAPGAASAILVNTESWKILVPEAKRLPMAGGRAFLCPLIGPPPNSPARLIYAVAPAKGPLRRWRRGAPVAETYNHRLWKYGSRA